jgi:hypothetical protein
MQAKSKQAIGCFPELCRCNVECDTTYCAACAPYFVEAPEPVYHSSISLVQLGHMRPAAPADFRVFDHRETEEDAPVACQVAKVLGEL